jgi:hypothetical protein
VRGSSGCCIRGHGAAQVRDAAKSRLTRQDSGGIADFVNEAAGTAVAPALRYPGAQRRIGAIVRQEGTVNSMLDAQHNRQVVMASNKGSRGEERLLRRIRSEFHEMPGLCLTVPQAARLWNLDSQTSETALQRLVADGYLAKTGDGRYVVATELNVRHSGRRISLHH